MINIYQTYHPLYSSCLESQIFPVSLCFFISFPLQAAKLPMSIIIVGVGQAEFDGKNEDACADLKFVTSDISVNKGLVKF